MSRLLKNLMPIICAALFTMGCKTSHQTAQVKETNEDRALPLTKIGVYKRGAERGVPVAYDALVSIQDPEQEWAYIDLSGPIECQAELSTSPYDMALNCRDGQHVIAITIQDQSVVSASLLIAGDQVRTLRKQECSATFLPAEILRPTEGEDPMILLQAVDCEEIDYS
jgi:hypothetical protein